MPQSLSYLLVHLIFSTKDRNPFFGPSILVDLHAYIASTIRNLDCECYRVGGVADHVHMAVRLSRTRTVAAFVEEVKTSSSRWIKTRDSNLSNFSWQRGYGIFSVGPSDRELLCQYIDTQETHHQKKTFQEEYVMFLKKYGIEYDERYVWD